MKRTYRRYLLTSSFLFVFFFFGRSQGYSSQYGALIETRSMNKRLQLDSVQFVKVLSINTIAGQQIDSVRQINMLVELKDQAIKQIKKEQIKELKTILTMQQYHQYKTDKEAMRNRIKSKIVGGYSENDIDE